MLLAVVVSILVLSVFGIEPESAAGLEKPNFVFVLTDDMRKDDLQFVPQTRRLLGGSGATFDNAFVTFAMCCPSRASILTGLYPHNHKILRNEARLGGGEPAFRHLDHSTLATWLDAAGYQTAYFGKYFNDYKGSYRPPGWDVWHAQGNPSIPRGTHETDFYAQLSEQFVRDSAGPGAPFLAYVAPHTPHPPANPPARYQKGFPNLRAPRTPAYDEKNVSDKPPWIRTLDRLSTAERNELDLEYRNRARELGTVDDLVGKLVGTLRATGELDNTYFIFTSDNGFRFGEHRMPPRKSTAYEPDIRVPLLVRGPGVTAGRNVNQMVINNDFAPTMADLAGVRPTRTVDGRSFAPLLRGNRPLWRTAFLVENPTGEVVPPYRAVRTDDRKKMVQYYTKGVREVYDLRSDPMELKNIQDAMPKKAVSRLQKRINALKDCSGTRCRAAEGP